MGVASENWGAHEEPDVLSVESLMRGDDLPNVSSPDKPFSLDEHRQRLGRDTSFVSELQLNLFARKSLK